jgi:hypothetical protein
MESPKEVKVRKIDTLRNLPVPIAKDLLSRPLSDLLHEGVDVPVRDMYGWVHRPSDARIEEARKRGKIARPMNAFMLYRFAYYELTKEYLCQRNHRSNGQAISKAIGLGWRSETTAVRRRFADLASIERHNHSALHPKAYQSATKRRQRPTRQAPPLPLTSAAEMHSDNVYNQNGRDPAPETFSPHIEQPGLQLNQSNDLQRPALPDCRVMSSSPVPSGTRPDPWFLGETLYECGDLVSRGFENHLAVEPMFELNDHPLCTGYINPRLLL